jgi:hypothetical protein
MSSLDSETSELTPSEEEPGQISPESIQQQIHFESESSELSPSEEEEEGELLPTRRPVLEETDHSAFASIFIVDRRVEPANKPEPKLLYRSIVLEQEYVSCLY